MAPHPGTIAADDPTADDVRALLAQHLTFVNEHTPPEDVHALDVARLVDPAISFFSLRVGGSVLAVGALKRLDTAHAELKSMHTAVEARGRGLGRAMVGHLLRVAAERGVRRVSLETGSTEAFAPARALYASMGFAGCGPFEGYGPSRNSTFMTIALKPDAGA